VKEKKDGGGLEKALLTIHFKIEFWRRARRANEGFSWKPIWCSDSAVKLFALVFQDKFVSADTDQSPYIHLDLEQNKTEYYSFPRPRLLNELREMDGGHTL
jgi:hypothetical protein